MDADRPIFLQIAESIEDSIVDGLLAAGEQAPSTNELAAFHRINPATAAKGLALLVEKAVLEKRRGIGMFVTADARALLLHERRQAFAAAFIAPLVAEAARLGLSPSDISALIRTHSERAAS